MIQDQLVEGILKRDKRSIARLISIIETERNEAHEYLNNLHERIGQAYRIGLTGPPGAGKSTIANQLAKTFLSNFKSVAIIAVDPTSPFTGGSVLGDRVRMNDIGLNKDVFIRSMATRGSLGGLSRKAIDCADVLDAAGYDFIIFETVGVGQSELDIAKAADTTIVTLVPESGDAIQAMKAGLIEIGDIFIINKFDRPEADKVYLALQSILTLHNKLFSNWIPPILKTIATANNGIVELSNEIENHRKHLLHFDLFNKNRSEKIKMRIKEIVIAQLSEKLWNDENLKILDDIVEDITSRKLSTYNVADKIISKLNL